MKKIAIFFAASTLLVVAAFAGDIEDLAGKNSAMPAIDAGVIWNQVNQHPFPQPNPTTLDTCIFTEFKNDKCYFKCDSGAVLAEPTVKPIVDMAGRGVCAIYIIRPMPAPAFKAQDSSWAKEAARELRKELAQQGITAEVTVVTEPGQKPFLAVEFQSWKDYEQIKDLFYQDPGDNPSYMDVKISPRVPKEITKGDLNWKKAEFTATDGTRIVVSYNPLSLGGEIIASPLWVTVVKPGMGFTGSERIRAMIMNYYDSSNIAANTLFETQQLDLKPVPPDSYGHGPLSYQAQGQRVELSQSHIGYGYNFRQEIAVVVDGKWLSDPVNGSHNFKFKMVW